MILEKGTISEFIVLVNTKVLIDTSSDKGRSYVMAVARLLQVARQQWPIGRQVIGERQLTIGPQPT